MAHTNAYYPAVVEPRTYVIALPRDATWQPEIARYFMEHLIECFPCLAFQIVAEANRVTWRIVDWRTEAPVEAITEAVHAYYPTAEVTYLAGPLDPPTYPFYRSTIAFQQVMDFVWPIKYVEDLEDFDPLIALTESLSVLLPGERIIYSLFLSVPVPYAYREGEKLITKSTVHPLQFLFEPGFMTGLWRIVQGQTREDRYHEVYQKVAREKLQSPLYQCLLLLQLDCPSQARLARLTRLAAQVSQFEQAPYHTLRPIPQPGHSGVYRVTDSQHNQATQTLEVVKAWVRGDNPRWQRARLILSPRELASLWHLPYEGFAAPLIYWVSARQAPAPLELGQPQGVLLGTNHYAGRERPVYLSYMDRQAHAYVAGKSGGGKSTFLHNLIHQDIAAGKGVGVIDPHGQLIRDILRSSIPKEREADVVLIDLANTTHPPPLNPFRLPPGISRTVALSQIMGFLKKVYEENWSSTRMEGALYSALVALLEDPEATPRDIGRIFLDPAYRARLLQKVSDPVALEYWYDEYEMMSEGMQRQTREPVLNRIRIFYRHPTVRNMVCHPHQIDFHQIVREGKILLANLKSDEAKSEQSILGALLMTNIQMATMGQDPNTEEPKLFYLYVDEVQRFVTTSLPEVFSEARKFGLSLTVANQFLGQLEGKTLEALMGNIGALLLFACGPGDARTLAPFLRPSFTSDDLLGLDRFQIIAKVQVKGRAVPAFNVKTPVPIPVPDDVQERVARIYAQAVASSTPWHRQEVEGWLEKRYQQPERFVPTGEVTDYD